MNDDPFNLALGTKADNRSTVKPVEKYRSYRNDPEFCDYVRTCGKKLFAISTET